MLCKNNVFRCKVIHIRLNHDNCQDKLEDFAALHAKIGTCMHLKCVFDGKMPNEANIAYRKNILNRCIHSLVLSREGKYSGAYINACAGDELKK